MIRTLSRLALAPFFLLLAVGSSSPGKKDDKPTSTTTTGASATGAATAAASAVFETIEVARPTSEDVKFKIDVPAGTQVKPGPSRVALTKGTHFALDLAAEKETIAEVKATMTGSDSGWTDVKVVKETPNVIVFRGNFLGDTRTRIHSSASLKGFWVTCSNPVSAMVEGSDIDDMVKTCESFAQKAGSSAPAVAAVPAKPAGGAAKAKAGAKK